MLLKDDVIFLLCVNYITFKFSILYLILNIENEATTVHPAEVWVLGDKKSEWGRQLDIRYSHDISHGWKSISSGIIYRRQFVFYSNCWRKNLKCHICQS